jgi:hypothetical protein
MKLFIIGNGFDIGHGLPTGYWDFRTFLDSVYPEFLRSFEEHYDIYPGMSAEAKKKTLWSRFESNLANIDEDTIIDIGTSIELNLESGDVGIEDTLYSHFTDEYQYIEKLAGYLKQWVRSIKIRDCLPRTTIIDKSNRDLFLTFNYTAVLENVYGITPGNIVSKSGSYVIRVEVSSHYRLPPQLPAAHHAFSRSISCVHCRWPPAYKNSLQLHYSNARSMRFLPIYLKNDHKKSAYH